MCFHCDIVCFHLDIFRTFKNVEILLKITVDRLCVSLNEIRSLEA